jgi:hypothetical protein
MTKKKKVPKKVKEKSITKYQEFFQRPQTLWAGYKQPNLQPGSGILVFIASKYFKKLAKQTDSLGHYAMSLTA